MLHIPSDTWTGCGESSSQHSVLSYMSSNIRIMNGAHNCLGLLNIPQPQFVSRRDKRVLCAFCNEGGGELWAIVSYSELCITPEALCRHVAAPCPVSGSITSWWSLRARILSWCRGGNPSYHGHIELYYFIYPVSVISVWVLPGGLECLWHLCLAPGYPG